VVAGWWPDACVRGGERDSAARSAFSASCLLSILQNVAPPCPQSVVCIAKTIFGQSLLVKCGRGSLCIDRRDRRRRSAGLYIGAGARGAFATHPFPANTMSMQRVSTRAVRGARGFHCTPAASASISFNSVISKVTNDADKARLIMHRQRDGSCVRWARRSLHEVHLQFDSAPSVRRLCYLCHVLYWHGEVWQTREARDNSGCLHAVVKNATVDLVSAELLHSAHMTD
jgi:hypothetical protein